jgi:4,5-dihydroxyphthalate decarboxylase
MVEVPITIACGNYDRTRPIRDGRVKVEGCETTYLPLYPEEIFFRAFRYQEFDVSELSFSSYIRTVAAGTSEYVGIPAFVSRLFRHSGMYVRADAGIREPKDLKGKRIGLPEYQLTACVWARAILEEGHGVRPADLHWVRGGLEQPGRPEKIAVTLPAELKIEAAPEGATLSEMLAAGEIDAIIAPRLPSCFERGHPVSAGCSHSRPRPPLRITGGPAFSRSCTWSGCAARSPNAIRGCRPPC